MYERLELYIETLTGTAFELRVSPYETVQDVKARIQKLEGIPISQQHLVWGVHELDDDSCLADYRIHNGATLKLVLNMRGGPINTRRIAMDDPSIREMAEYFSEASRDDLTDKVSNRPVTVIVYHNGDQLNFFRIVDRDSSSPMSESLSGASMYNMYDDDDDEDGPTHEKLEENDKTREKMKLLKSKMENMNISKKPKKIMLPRPPSASRPGSKVRLRRITSSGRKSASLNRNTCLPPLGQTGEEPGAAESGPARFDPATLAAAKELFEAAAASSDGVPLTGHAPLRHLDSVESARMKAPTLASLREDQSVPEEAAAASSHSWDKPPSDHTKPQLSKETILRRAQQSLRASRKWDFSQELLLKNEPKPPSAPRRKAPSPASYSSHTVDKLIEDEAGAAGLAGGRDSYIPPPSTKYNERRAGGGVMLESLNPSEVRAMSGMLSSLVRSASKSRAGFLAPPGYKDVGRVTTPEGRLVSGRLRRLSASKDGRQLLSPTHRLPAVKSKKKSKRCCVCGKKTGLANSYTCRCSNNFCATHRYAEAHNCTFDYKTEGRKLIETSNPVVTAPKLPKI